MTSDRAHVLIRASTRGKCGSQLWLQKAAYKRHFTDKTHHKNEPKLPNPVCSSVIIWDQTAKLWKVLLGFDHIFALEVQVLNVLWYQLELADCSACTEMWAVHPGQYFGQSYKYFQITGVHGNTHTHTHTSVSKPVAYGSHSFFQVRHSTYWTFHMCHKRCATCDFSIPIQVHIPVPLPSYIAALNGPHSI